MPPTTPPPAPGSGRPEPIGATPEPRWLDEDERAAWVAAAAVIIRLPAALDAQMQREAGLTFFEYMVLAILSEAEELTLQMSTLATRTSSSLSRLSHVVGRLQQRGWLVRTRVPGSGRRTTATLTAAGLAEVRAAAPGHVDAVRRLLIDLLDAGDLDALRRIGTAVGSSIDREQLDQQRRGATPTPADPEGTG